MSDPCYELHVTLYKLRITEYEAHTRTRSIIAFEVNFAGFSKWFHTRELVYEEMALWIQIILNAFFLVCPDLLGQFPLCLDLLDQFE